MAIIKIKNEQGEFEEIPVIQGKPGENGKTPVKGVDYFTEEDINELNIPTKTSELINDSEFVTSIEVKRIEIVAEYPEIEEEGILYMKVVE